MLLLLWDWCETERRSYILMWCSLHTKLEKIRLLIDLVTLLPENWGTYSQVLKDTGLWKRPMYLVTKNRLNWYRHSEENYFGILCLNRCASSGLVTSNLSDFKDLSTDLPMKWTIRHPLHFVKHELCAWLYWKAFHCKYWTLKRPFRQCSFRT